MELTQIALMISNIQLLLACAILFLNFWIEYDKLAIDVIHCILVAIISTLQIIHTIVKYHIAGEDYKISLLLSLLWVLDFISDLTYVIKKGKNLKKCK